MLNRSHDYKQRLIRNKQALLGSAALIGILWIGLLTWTVLAQERQENRDTVLFYEGQDLLDEKKPDAAIEKFQELLVNYPQSNIRDLSYYWLGKSYLDLNKFQEAKETLASLKKEFPMSPLVKRLRGALKTAEKNPTAPAPPLPPKEEKAKKVPPPTAPSAPPKQETAQAPKLETQPPVAPTPPVSQEPGTQKEPGKSREKSKEEIRRKAIALFQKIIRDAPDSPEAAKAGDRLKEMGVEIKAEKVPSHSAALVRDPAQAEFEQDLNLFNHGDYSTAVGKFESFLAKYSDSPLRLKVEYYLAETYRLMEQEP